MIDLEPYIYRPHPIFRLPSREDAAVACKTPEGEKEFREAMERRGLRIYQEQADPFRYGYEPDHWKAAEEILKENDELLISGGNRSSKTEFAAKYCVKRLMEQDNTRIACFHTTHQSSLQNQQPVIWKYLPAEFKQKKIKGKVANISYSQKSGFTDNSFILPNGSQCWFMHYSQDRNTVEGLEIDVAWADELIPFDLLETLRYRLVTRAGKLVLSFTPVEGFSLTVKDFIQGGEILEWKPSELLPGKNMPSGPEGHMPYLMKCRRPKSYAVFWRTMDNRYSPYDELKKKLAGLHDAEIKVRAYGWATSTTGAQFRFTEEHVIEPGKIPSEGTNFMVADPAGSRNWFMLWARVVDDCIYIYREWPDASMGDWTIPSAKHDGAPGSAQKSGGGGLAIWQYKNLITEIEGGEEIFMRLIDPRAASNNSLDGQTILEKLHMDEYGFEPMHFYPAPGKDIQTGVALINDLLYYNQQEPVDDENYPRLYVSRSCKNLIYSLREWTGLDGNKGASKDPVDCLRYLVTDDNLMVEEEQVMMRGGGSY